MVIIVCEKTHGSGLKMLLGSTVRHGMGRSIREELRMGANGSGVIEPVIGVCNSMVDDEFAA